MSPTISVIVSFALYTLTKSECPSDLECNFCLSNEDFLDGTYRILESGKYCLSEDIIFNPRQPEDLSSPNGDVWNWFPGANEKADLEDYPGTLKYIDIGHPVNGPFAGGFFAAISIETVNVEIDLNTYSISQHPYFYTQQRFYSNIEVQNKPYEELSKRTTGIWMWGPNAVVDNVYIHNGELGLSSHHGIHSNGATNVVIEDLVIHDFEVGGIQFNHFTNLELRNLEIGPSATNVKLNGYYGQARFDLMTLHYLKGSPPEYDTITFADGRTKTVLEVQNHLIAAMDIAFRYANDELTEEDYGSQWYEVAMDLFANEPTDDGEYVPDGSTIYGVLFNNWMDAVQGFGQFNQYGTNTTKVTSGLTIENVYIHDLKKSVNEIPAIYMNPCYTDEDYYGDFLYRRQNDKDVVRSPLGSTMDLRLMIEDGHNVIDNGLLLEDPESSFAEYLHYKGNVLSDAQIGISLYDTFKSRINIVMQNWAVQDSSLIDPDDPHENTQSLPTCMEFLCNSDYIFQTNKGVIGARFDDIQNVAITDLTVENLWNLSPLASDACGDYSGPEDGGNPYQPVGVGNMNGDIRGISIYGSSVQFDGNIDVTNLHSAYGDIYGIHIMRDSFIEFDSDEDDDSPLMMTITDLYPEYELTEEVLGELESSNQWPFPNNFNGQCNILIDDVNVMSPRQPSVGVITIDGEPTGLDGITCESPENLPQIKPLTVTKVSDITDGIVKEKDDGSRKINYIHVVYIGLAAIFCIAIIGFICCIVWNYRKFVRAQAVHTTGSIITDKEDELTRFIIDHQANYGTSRKE